MSALTQFVLRPPRDSVFLTSDGRSAFARVVARVLLIKASDDEDLAQAA